MVKRKSNINDFIDNDRTVLLTIKIIILILSLIFLGISTKTIQDFFGVLSIRNKIQFHDNNVQK